MDLDKEEQTSNQTSIESQLDPNNFHHWRDIQNCNGLASPPYQPCIQPQLEAEKPQQNTMSRSLALTPRERQLEKAVQVVMRADVEASECRRRLLFPRKELLKFRSGSTPAPEGRLDIAQHRLILSGEVAQKANANLSQAQHTLLRSSEELLTEKSAAMARQSLLPNGVMNPRDDENGAQYTNTDISEFPQIEHTEANATPSVVFLFFLSDQSLGAIPHHLSECNTASKFYEQAATA